MAEKEQVRLEIAFEGGQIIGGTVNITNQATMNYVPIIVPGYNLTGYNASMSYLREIRNS